MNVHMSRLEVLFDVHDLSMLTKDKAEDFGIFLPEHVRGRLV